MFIIMCNYEVPGKHEVLGSAHLVLAQSRERCASTGQQWFGNHANGSLSFLAGSLLYRDL